MNKQGNTYTFIYSIVLVVVVAAILAIVSLSLKPYQDENIENEKRQNILSSVNVSSTRRLRLNCSTKSSRNNSF